MIVSEKVHEIVRPMLFATTVLWASITLTVVGLMVAALLVVDGETRAVQPNIQTALIALAVGCGLISLWFRRRMLSDDRLRRLLTSDAAPACLDCAAGDDGLDENKLLQIESLSPFERKVVAIPRWHFMPFMVSLSLNEAIAIVGFIIASLSHDGSAAVPFGIAAILLNVLMYPRFDSMIARAQGLYR